METFAVITHQVTNSYGNYNYNAYVYSDIGWKPHFHGNYELIYVIEGSTSITVNGVENPLSEKEFLLIAPYSVHSMRISENALVWIGVFSSDHVSEFEKNNRGVIFSSFKCEDSIDAFLRKHLLYQGTPERYMSIACLNAVCDQCIKNAKKTGGDANVALAGKIIEYISSHSGEKISMREVSDALGYEYHYFSLLFNNYFEMNFKSFINMFRFEKACNMLSDTSKSISYVCFECGFETVRNFNRVFKELCGVTPSEFRQKVAEK